MHIRQLMIIIFSKNIIEKNAQKNFYYCHLINFTSIKSRKSSLPVITDCEHRIYSDKSEEDGTARMKSGLRWKGSKNSEIRKKMDQLRIRGVRSYTPDRDICFDISSKVTLIYGQSQSIFMTSRRINTGTMPLRVCTSATFRFLIRNTLIVN